MRIFKKIAIILTLSYFNTQASDKLIIENWLNDIKEKKVETREKIALIDKCRAFNFRLNDTAEYNAIFWMLEHAREDCFSQLHKEKERAIFLKKFQK